MATAEEYASWIVANADKKGTPEFEKVAKAYTFARSAKVKAPIETPAFEKEAANIANATPAEVIAGNPVTRFALGAADMLRGGAQLAGNAVGLGGMFNENESQLSSLVDRGRQAYGSEGMDFTRLAGGILSPVGLGIAKGLAPAASAAQRIGQGAAVGTVGGLLNPVPNATSTGDYLGTAALQAGAGGLLGAAIPSALEGVKGGAKAFRNVIDEFLPGGKERAVGRLGNAVAGTRREDVIRALETSTDNVPGSKLTAGQASVPANSAEFAALQKIAAEADPSKYAGAGGVEGAQEAARRGLIQQVGKTPADLEAAMAARDAAAKQNYGAAFAQTVKVDPKLAQMAQNPYFKDALGDAMKLAEANKVDPKQNLTEFLQLVKFSLDKKLTQTGDNALGAAEKSAVYDLKKSLVGWMGDKNKLYELARQDFAKASKPINQMEVGQQLEKSLATPVGAGERPAVFANAVANAPRTIKASLGSGGPRFESLSDVLTPEQVGKVQSVLKDLTQDAQFEKLAGPGMTAARKITGKQLDTIPQVGFLDRAATIFNNITRRIEGFGGERTMKQLAETMQDPKEMARLMRAATPAERKQISDVILRLGAANATEMQGQ